MVRRFSYDYLILSAGSITHSFDIPGIEAHTYYLKTLEEAVALKNHIICCFEGPPGRQTKIDAEAFSHLSSWAVAPQGWSTPRALSELVHGPLVQDYRSIDFQTVRIILLEASDRLVANMPETVSIYTLERLKKMGVDVRLGAKAAEVTPNTLS